MNGLRFLGKASLKERSRKTDLAMQPKGHHVKGEIAQQLHRQTPMGRQSIADQLRMGSTSYVSNLLSSVNIKL
jgi:hypothetical protein